MQDELERARKRESHLAAVFTAMDTAEAAQVALGSALGELRELGVAQAELAEMTGLSTREVSAALKAAKDHRPEDLDVVEASESQPSDDHSGSTHEH